MVILMDVTTFSMQIVHLRPTFTRFKTEKSGRTNWPLKQNKKSKNSKEKKKLARLWKYKMWELSAGACCIFSHKRQAPGAKLVMLWLFSAFKSLQICSIPRNSIEKSKNWPFLFFPKNRVSNLGKEKGTENLHKLNTFFCHKVAFGSPILPWLQ